MSTSTSTPVFHHHHHDKNLTAASTVHEPRRSPTFLALPLELHLLIASRLSFPSYLSLRLTHPYLYHALAAPLHPTPLRNLDQCARVAVRTYLAPYLTPRAHSESKANEQLPTTTTAKPTAPPTDDQAQQQRCAFCGNVYPLRLFKSAASPACSPHDLGPARSDVREEAVAGQELTADARGQRSDVLAHTTRGEPGWDVVELPQRVCCWHVGRLTRIVREDRDSAMAEWGDAIKEEGTEATATGRIMERGVTQPLTWVSRVEQLCTHCGAIQAWRPCRCRCQSCGLRPARTYTRYAEQEWSCAGFVFWRDNEGKLWVRETVMAAATDGTHGRTSYVDKPVMFE